MESAHTPEPRKPRIPAELLDRYIAGECDAAERARVTAWLGSMPESTFQELFRLGAGIAPERTGTAWRHLRGTTTLDHEHEIPGERQDSVVEEVFSREERRKEIGVSPQFLRQGIASIGPRTLRAGLWSLGAVTVLVMTFFVLRSGSRSLQRVTRSYTTGVNQQGVLTLNDGTRVTLAPQTTVRLIGFSAQTRTVSVDGKAYFEVVHVDGAPFEVHSGSVTARVLGTAFLVDHAPHSSHVRVAVEEGKVRVFTASRTNSAVTVTRGYVGEITDSAHVVAAVPDSITTAEWFRGRLVFHHASVATVLQTLTRWYGYQFRYTDSTLLQRNVTVGISVRSPALALATLEQLLRVNLTVRGDTITLAPQVEGQREKMSRIRSYDVWTPTREIGR